MTRYPDELLEISTENKTICITPNHPIYALRNGQYEWIPAGELKEGDEVVVICVVRLQK